MYTKCEIHVMRMIYLLSSMMMISVWTCMKKKLYQLIDTGKKNAWLWKIRIDDGVFIIVVDFFFSTLHVPCDINII